MTSTSHPSPEMHRFAGRTALVTGASRGLGRAIAVRLATEGAYMYVGYQRRESAAAQTLETIRQGGGDGALLGFDVRDVAAVREAVATIERDRGGVEVLVNNAAIVRDQMASMLSASDWRDVIDVNLAGVFHCCQAVARVMMAGAGGAIVNVSSVAGVRASPGQSNYSASKGGVLALTRTLAVELARRGIRVNAVVPGLLTTGMAKRLDHRRQQAMLGAIAQRRLGEADEVAAVVAFLASDEASYIIGQAVVVDGGLSL